MATDLLNSTAYDSFFDENHTKEAHVAGLLTGEYATNHEVQAAANCLLRPIVVYVLNKHNAIVTPDHWERSHDPVYLQLDQRGVEHYDLLEFDKDSRTKGLLTFIPNQPPTSCRGGPRWYFREAGLEEGLL